LNDEKKNTKTEPVSIEDHYSRFNIWWSRTKPDLEPEPLINSFFLIFYATLRGKKTRITCFTNILDSYRIACVKKYKALVACDFHLKWVSLNVFFTWFFSTQYIYFLTVQYLHFNRKTFKNRYLSTPIRAHCP
jgi:hypothetical protein